MGLEYLVADKVKVQQYKVHIYFKMDDMCALRVGESSHFTSISTMVSTLYWMYKLKLHTILSIYIVFHDILDELVICNGCACRIV